MAAIFIYSLYNVQDYPVLAWLDSKRSHIRPYALTTSQWQRWNLFSPDPLRRVIEMDFHIYVEGEWLLVKTLSENHVGFWQRAPELKTMRRMEDKQLRPLRKRYADVFCIEERIPEETPIRITKRWHVIPKHDITQSTEWWRNWQPTWREPEILLQDKCPALP